MQLDALPLDEKLPAWVFAVARNRAIGPSPNDGRVEAMCQNGMYRFAPGDLPFLRGYWSQVIPGVSGGTARGGAWSPRAGIVAGRPWAAGS